MKTQAREITRSASDDALNLAAECARRYVREIGARRVAPAPGDVAALAKFHEGFPATPSDPRDVVKMLDELGSQATVATSGRRYFGFVVGGVLPAVMGANWLAGAWDQNACLRVMSPVAAELEDVVLRWICEALGLPAECEGGLVTCATAANFTALAAARYALLAKSGWNVGEDGMFGAPPIQVVVGEEVHASMLKALSLIGFGIKRVTVVEADAQGRMRVDNLPRLSERAIVCIQAGNVNSGSFDPALEICRRAKEQGAWVHVDGAFGLWARVSPKYRHLTQGFELADSWATDAHKWPNVNYDSGIVMVRDGAALRAAMTMSAAYLAPGTRREPRAPYAGGFTPGARSGAVGGAEVFGTLRIVRFNRADMRDGEAIRERPAHGRVRGVERGGDQSSAGVVWRRRDHARSHTPHPGRWHVLVRRHGMAGKDGDANQRVVVGDNRTGRGSQPRGNGANRARLRT